MSQTAAPDYSYAGEKVERVALAATDVRFDDRGLIPAVVQQVGTGEVLMVAWMNEESLRLTFATGTSWFWSRSRQELWHKGATSGQVQTIVEMRVDCDQDALWIRVKVAGDGGCCHTGRCSCFYRVQPLRNEAGKPLISCD